MKKLNTLYLLGLLFLFTACDKEETNLEVNNDNLAGEWELTGFTYGGRSTNEVGGETYRSNFAGNGRDLAYTVRFNADGTYTSSGSYTIDATYAFGGQEFSQSLTIDDALDSGTYTLNGDELSITRDEDGETSVATILQLTNDLLIFELQQTKVSTSQNATSTVIIDGDFQMRRE